MTNATTKLEDTVHAFCEFIEDLPGDLLGEAEWGPREVLCHLVFHHQVYVDQIGGVLDHRPIPPPMGTFAELNARAVEEYRKLSTLDLINHFKGLNRQLLFLYQGCNPAEVRIEIKAGSKLRTFSELIPEVEAHIRNHLVKVQRRIRAMKMNNGAA